MRLRNIYIVKCQFRGYCGFNGCSRSCKTFGSGSSPNICILCNNGISEQTESPQVRNLVLIKQDNVPPLQWLQWKRERILKLYPERDDVRVVDMRTPTSVLHRAVISLARLPIQ
ncbi:hypothetical protein EVAR_29151_1 [Eumeta japonica]|uniref:DUF5641 domain-containing protein n=1 Tax=Eumeta variegata TaxID=151549 RepID=A0A4C1VCJ2_EUMVA|nr:hypothetical protein EVAR_29151_1 [Eumeta japonica]